MSKIHQVSPSNGDLHVKESTAPAAKVAIRFLKIVSDVSSFPGRDLSYLDCAVCTQRGQSQGSKKVQDVEHVQVPLSFHEAAHDTLDARVVLDNLTCCRVEAFSVQHRILLDHICYRKDWGESVGELQNAHRRNESSQTRKIGNGSSDDEGNGPIHGNHADPKELAGLGV